jgi:ABC-2 type transport system permease protein
MKPIIAHARAETKMTLARGESLLLTVGIPLFLLIALNATNFISVPTSRRIDFLAPGVIALCVMSTSLVSLSISTGFDRYYGVLRRLYTTPLSARRLIIAKIISVVVTELIQIVVLGGVALALGWKPHGGITAVVIGVGTLLLASAGFGGIGLFLAGRLRAEINLAASNGFYLVLLLVSGFVVPSDNFPHAVRAVIDLLPSGALAQIAQHLTLGQEIAWSPVLVLVVWAGLAPLLAARTFRFD